MSLIIKMDAIKTKEHLRKSIPYIFNERKTDGLCFSNAGVTPEQILDTFFLTSSYALRTAPEKVIILSFLFQRMRRYRRSRLWSL